MNFEINHLFKIPNLLCYIRIILVPVFCFMFFGADTPGDYYMAAGIVLISGFTDFLDGQIARRCNMITDIGKLLDPFADKLMQLAMLICLTIKIRFMYLLVIYLIVKEVSMCIAAVVIYKKYKKRLNGAKWYGKVCTAVLYAVMLTLIAFPGLNNYVQKYLLIVCLSALTLAFVMYIRIYIKMLNDTKLGNKEFVIY